MSLGHPATAKIVVAGDWRFTTADATPAQLHAFAYGPGPSGRLPSSSTVGVRLAALRGFYDFARRMRLIERNPADDVKRPKAQEPTPRGLNADELQRLLEAVPATPSGARDWALMITAVLTGLRRAELLVLHAGDLERRGGSVFYHVRTKGGNLRHRELPDPAYDAIERALKLQGTPLESLPEEAPLFAISSHGFYKNLKSYAERAGLDTSVHLRHDVVSGGVTGDAWGLPHSRERAKRCAPTWAEADRLGSPSRARRADRTAKVRGCDRAGLPEAAG